MAGRQSGNVLVFVLVAYLIILTLGAASLRVAFLEMKQSEYAFKWKQAGQACQAGIEDTMEKIFMQLLNQADADELPVMAVPAGGPYQYSADASCYYVLEPEGAVLRDWNDEACTYEFSCTGWAGESRFRMRVTCQYLYYKLYEDDGSGRPRFIKREFRNRGNATRCEIER